jgi:hypothetical protein
MIKYNGYTNYETWCICLHILNDEQLYNLAKDCINYTDFKQKIAINPPYHAEVSVCTPTDDVMWSDTLINVAEVNQACFTKD